jgi:FixJ family two-component response regulator
MALIVSGMMNKQIAAKLGLSEITIKVHRASLIRKMNVKSLAELVRQADALAIGRS